MQSLRLEALGERLLRAGVAPRHVRRCLGEWHDHYDDALRQGLVQGMPPGSGGTERLGTTSAIEELLAREVYLSRSE